MVSPIEAPANEPSRQRYSSVSQISSDLDMYNPAPSATIQGRTQVSSTLEEHDYQRNSGVENVPLDSISHQKTPSTFLLEKATHPPPRGWPSSPRRIKTSIRIGLWNIIVDILLFACSVAYLAFALTVNSYNQAPTADNPRATDALTSATKWGPTVFPILFAAVVGRAAHAILSWRLEVGESLGVLDVLAGSTSLTSTVTSQIQLRKFNLLGIGLIVFWALSPVGGQASFRQMTVGTKTTSQPAEFTYMVPDGNLYGFGSRTEGAVQVNSLFLSAMISKASIKGSSLDTWGNFKIPRVEHYEKIAAADSEGWLDTRNATGDTYSSIIGVPVSGINSSQYVDYNFHVETMYLHLNCSIVPSAMITKIPNEALNVSGWTGFLWTLQNMTERARLPREDLKPLNFTYSSRYQDQGDLRCTIETSYVEVEVLCPDVTTCATNRIRRSRLSHPPSAYTQLDLPGNWRKFAEAYIQSVDNYNDNAFSPLDAYLARPDDPLAKPDPDLQSASDYGIRLGQLFNAYWTGINGRSAVPSGLNKNTSNVNGNITWPYQNTSLFTGADLKARAWPTEGTRSTKFDVIQAHTAWIVTLCIASSMLIIASLVAPLARFFLARGPDLMMNISSLSTFNNPYIPLPSSGTYLDASDRSRLLKDFKIRFGDVASTADVGSLAIGSVNGSEGPTVMKIRKDRLYE